MFSKQITQKAREELSKRKTKALLAAENKCTEIFSKYPRAEEIGTELNTIGVQTAKVVLAGGDVANELEKLSEKSLALQTELKELLTSHGYPQGYLDVHFFCEKCCDTGAYESDDGTKTLVCDCYKKLLSQIAYDELNAVSPLKLSTFETFDLSYYSMDIDEEKYGKQSPYVRMSKILEFCKNYAQNFNLHSKSLLLRGPTGLGKTHLSLSIANELIKKGFGVVYASAPAILQKLEREHFSNGKAEAQTLSGLEECDLLIIDDLGTEFDTSYSNATLYNLFNTRILKNKPTIINTNCTLEELAQTYSSRFVSRLEGSADRLNFYGEDLRGRI
ncbi:MAG: ATP-binding protein [Oscillospiraceae bacterium]|jgi:DNA replication protein DnaC|nr:ATP-binding protein [Oscillospiraceae bacterium]